MICIYGTQNKLEVKKCFSSCCVQHNLVSNIDFSFQNLTTVVNRLIFEVAQMTKMVIDDSQHVIPNFGVCLGQSARTKCVTFVTN